MELLNRGKWNQDKIQELFVRMIGNCELSKDQIEKISNNLVYDNRCLGSDTSRNRASIERFNLEKESLLAPASNWIEETRKKVA